MNGVMGRALLNGPGEGRATSPLVDQGRPLSGPYTDLLFQAAHSAENNISFYTTLILLSENPMASQSIRSACRR